MNYVGTRPQPLPEVKHVIVGQMIAAPAATEDAARQLFTTLGGDTTKFHQRWDFTEAPDIAFLMVDEFGVPHWSDPDNTEQQPTLTEYHGPKEAPR